jgi:hypothetical protein
LVLASRKDKTPAALIRILQPSMDENLEFLLWFESLSSDSASPSRGDSTTKSVAIPKSPTLRPMFAENLITNLGRVADALDICRVTRDPPDACFVFLCWLLLAILDTRKEFSFEEYEAVRRCTPYIIYLLKTNDTSSDCGHCRSEPAVKSPPRSPN